jgi:hypothetical protein
MGWEAYFETLFEKIDGKMLNEHKAKYQGKPLALTLATASSA